MFVYILQSDSTGRYYTGSAMDLENRINEHNCGGNKSTIHGIPWRLVHVIETDTRSEANRIELKIKSRGAGRFLEHLKKPG